MSNSERILQTLDRHLDHEISLVIYGRAALATRAQIEAAFAEAVIPDNQELRDAFEKAKPAVLRLLD
jgi:hypothetical protein